MVKRTIGFNWGAAGLGMSEWGGCHLADVLAAHGVSTDPATWDDGRHVAFRGPDKELPAGADGRGRRVVYCSEEDGVSAPPRDDARIFREDGSRRRRGATRG